MWDSLGNDARTIPCPMQNDLPRWSRSRLGSDLQKWFPDRWQFILEADLTDEERQLLLSTPRQDSVHLRVGGEDVILRDQAPLSARKDVKSPPEGGVDIGDWIHQLNQRVYFFTDQGSMEKLLEKYVQMDGTQEVVSALTAEASRIGGNTTRAREPEHRNDRSPEWPPSRRPMPSFHSFDSQTRGPLS